MHWSAVSKCKYAEGPQWVLENSLYWKPGHPGGLPYWWFVPFSNYSWESAPSLLPSSVTFLKGSHHCTVSMSPHSTVWKWKQLVGYRFPSTSSVIYICRSVLTRNLGILQSSSITPESSNFVLSGFQPLINKATTCSSWMSALSCSEIVCCHGYHLV